MSNVMNHGDRADNFYIILRGIASVLVPNLAIKDRSVKWRDFQKLKEWKEKDFDIRAEEAKTKHFDDYITQTRKV